MIRGTRVPEFLSFRALGMFGTSDSEHDPFGGKYMPVRLCCGLEGHRPVVSVVRAIAFPGGVFPRLNGGCTGKDTR